MRKINIRGIEQANKVMLMAASAYNLKKLMKHLEKHRKVAAMAIKKEIIKQVENCVLIFNMFYTAFLNNFLKVFEVKPNYSIEPILLK